MTEMEDNVMPAAQIKSQKSTLTHEVEVEKDGEVHILTCSCSCAGSVGVGVDTSADETKSKVVFLKGAVASKP